MRSACIGCLLVLSVFPGFAAEPAGQPLLRAAMVLKTFDHYAVACKRTGGFKAAEERQVASWEDAQDVQTLREYLDEHPLPPRQLQELDKALAQVTSQAQTQRANPCAAAVAATKAPGSQFGKLLGDGAAPLQAAPPSAAATGTSTAQLLAEIHSLAFSTRATMGSGGLIALDIYPVVLFKSGDALTNVRRLGEGGDKVSMQKRHTADFTHWRRFGGELQIQERDGNWKKLPFQTTYARLRDGLRLDGLYRSSSGTGNVAVGGTQSVTAWDDYRFMPDGQVTRSGGAGSHAEAGGSSRARAGRYRVEGLTLLISYADGGSERRILIADPKDTRGTVWIDGEGYLRRER